jgi:hypothetical protein
MRPMADLLFIAGLMWLVVVLPAAVITALKDQWLLFFTGFLTLGTVWLVGAATMAEPGSWWATRFYDEQKLAQAADRDVGPRPTRIMVVTVASIAASLLALVLFAAFPTPILGVDGKSLEYSVGGGSLVLGSPPPCRHEAEGTWMCSRWDNQYSGAVDYRVKVGPLGCWTARQVGRRGEGSDEKLSGCVTLRDHLRLFD